MTRWSSAFMILIKYKEISEYKPLIVDEKIVHFLRTNRDKMDIDQHLNKFSNLQSVTIDIQRDDISMAEFEVY